jgi:transcription elongation factor Elf1
MKQLGIIFLNTNPDYIFCPWCGNKINPASKEGYLLGGVVCGNCNNMVSFRVKKTKKE